LILFWIYGLTALKNKEANKTGVCKPRGRALFPRWAEDQDQHRPRGGALFPRRAERAFSSSIPAQTQGQSPFPRRAERAFSSSRPAQTKDRRAKRAFSLFSRPAQTEGQSPLSQTGRVGCLTINRGRALSHNGLGCADRDQHRTGPARTGGQSPLSQADQDQRLNVDVTSHKRC